MKTTIPVCIAITVVAIAIIGLIIRSKRKTIVPALKDNQVPSCVHDNSESLTEQDVNSLSIAFETVQALTAEEESHLVEIKDQNLLARIDNVIPGAMQAVTNSGAAEAAQEIAEGTGKLYRAVIPEGAVLDKSRAMENAFRASYRDAPNRIQGNANLVPVDEAAMKGVAAVSVANAVMNVASMVVGQYYMSQINDQLNDITDGIDKIAEFQDNEYKSKVLALVADVQKTSSYQSEIIENDDLRNRELSHLRDLEPKCAELLGHANYTLEGFSERTRIDYKTYESLIVEANKWYQFQQILIEVMYRISDLTYTLNLGSVSRENSSAMCVPYSKQASDALNKLKSWHQNIGTLLAIDIDAERRRRQGVGGFLMNIPALFDDDLHYKSVPKRTVKMIRNQSNDTVANETGDDLFNTDVQLVAKDGKLFYLPATQPVETPEGEVQ